VCDALKTHEAGARGNDAIALAGCWAHVYRKFEEAAKDHPEALLAMKWIGELYAIDARADDDLEKRAELRRRESAEILAGVDPARYLREAVLAQARSEVLLPADLPR
jgi:hypothetical protein